MLDIYKSHLKAKEDEKNNIKNKIDKQIIFKFKNKDFKFKMPFDVLLKKYMNIAYGYDGAEILDSDYYRVVNYLKNKSLRSFYEDMIAFFNGFEEKEEIVDNEKNTIIKYNMEPLKERLNPNYMEKFHNKYDAIEWIWNHYIENLDQIILNYKQRKKDIGETQISINILKNLMIVNGKEIYSITRNEKTYARLFMQDFFIKKIIICEIKEEQNITNLKIKKEFNLGGMIELMLRTFVPMNIFENLVNKMKIDIFKFNYEEFRQFIKDDIFNNLKDSMHKLSLWPMKYKKVKESEYKFIGIEIDFDDTEKYEEYKTIIDRTSFNEEHNYYISPLKYFAYLSEYFTCSKNNGESSGYLKTKYTDIFRINKII